MPEGANVAYAPHGRGGAAALTARKHPGRPPVLALRQKLQVRRWINGKDPRQYGWTLARKQ